MADEPILQQSDVATGVQFPDIERLYKKHLSTFWMADIFHFDEDLSDWDRKLNDDQRYFVKHILAFFARADLLVADNLMKRFSDEIQLYESKKFCAFQCAMEHVHNETYENMLRCFVRDPAEITGLLNAHLEIPCIKKKAQWARKWMDSERPFGERVVAFICVEGIHFSSSFAGIYWLKEQALMKQLCKSNEYISRDEALHVHHGILLHKHLREKPATAVVHEIMREAVDLEIEFSRDAIPCRFIGLNADMMADYIRFIANKYLQMMKLPALYPEIQNPLKFMEKINAKMHSNFFESEETGYSMSSSANLQDDDDYDF